MILLIDCKILLLWYFYDICETIFKNENLGIKTFLKSFATVKNGLLFKLTQLIVSRVKYAKWNWLLLTCSASLHKFPEFSLISMSCVQLKHCTALGGITQISIYLNTADAYLGVSWVSKDSGKCGCFSNMLVWKHAASTVSMLEPLATLPCRHARDAATWSG